MARYKEYGYDIQNGKAIIPEYETDIKDEAFENCEELTSVESPLWIRKIGGLAFGGHSSLTEVRIPKGCHVDDSAFEPPVSSSSATDPPQNLSPSFSNTPENCPEMGQFMGKEKFWCIVLLCFFAL